MLHEFLADHREELLARCRAKVALRATPSPTPAELRTGVPRFLDDLVDILEHRLTTSDEMDDNAGRHGRERLLQGFSVTQVVQDYGDVCQSITELAIEADAPITPDEFRRLNLCLDDAIARAVSEYGREHLETVVATASSREEERLAFLAHELRNLVNTATVAFDVLKRGDVAIGGSTGHVLGRSLTGLRDLIARSVEDVRLRHGAQDHRPVAVAELLRELGAAAALQAAARGLTLTVTEGADDVTVLADRPILSAVIVNLLQNACKFTHAGTGVTLGASVRDGLVTIAVADECGGLGDVDPEQFFRPYEQRHTDRSGLGLGLSFSRWGAGVNHGTVTVRDIPDTGCVFSVHLPQHAA